MLTYKELKNELQIHNIDVDYPEQFLHVYWSQLREVLIKHKLVK